MANGVTTRAFHTARPGIQVAGEERGALTDGLTGLLVEETRAGLYRCEATFGNWGTHDGAVTYLYFDRELLDFGASFSVVSGDGEAEAVVFEGRITGLEALYPQGSPPQLTVLAEDRFQDLRMTRRTRTFEDMTDGEVMERIAADHGLRPRLDIDDRRHRVLAQLNQSDLAFLRDRADAIDAEVRVEGDILHAASRGRLERGRLTLAYGARLREFSALADLAHQCTGYAVSGWDPAAKEPLVGEAGPAALQPELNGLRSGPAVLRQSLGPRREQAVHLAPGSQDEARALAEAGMRRLGRRFVTGWGVAEGDARIRVGARVTLERLGPLFDGEYAVSEARHTFDGRDGYRTRFSVERPGLGTS